MSTDQKYWDACFIKTFSALVAAAAKAEEREACAKVCDELAELNRTSPTDSMWEQEECAAAIRARGVASIRGETK